MSQIGLRFQTPDATWNLEAKLETSTARLDVSLRAVHRSRHKTGLETSTWPGLLASFDSFALFFDPTASLTSILHRRLSFADKEFNSFLLTS
jgi:hypothetical protein